MKILIADDSKLTRAIIKKVITQNGIAQESIVEAENGDDALKIMGQNSIELLMLDWLMPGLDGLGLIKEMKGSSELSKVPVIMMTVVNEFDKVQEALSYGIEDYIIKPLSEEALWNRIYGVLAKNKKVNLETIDLLRKEFQQAKNPEDYISHISDILLRDSEHHIFGVYLFLEMFHEELKKSEADEKISQELFDLFKKRVVNKRSLENQCDRLFRVPVKVE
ncbi:MAG: hypothetical protein IEMM0008_1281 [bacterium]|nr:MAG: hypothetical protein IEMM0008_1281 [bacterium]